MKSEALLQAVRAESGVQHVSETHDFDNLDIDKTGIKTVEDSGSSFPKGGVSALNVYFYFLKQNKWI